MKLQEKIQIAFPFIVMVLGSIGAYGLIIESKILGPIIYIAGGMSISGLILVAEW